ncbi:4-alpha-glucanotransferase [Bacteroides sp. 214]|uniref:4-alpha-glucanotransferase n=1 Tax=Bacteroides sp. 214 TaxID=2302935 RepID=UPI0013D8609D|nr:4-alpha-glucanotransferase [Bacteroides sp. 214]NDW11727.1 4-alpha-glucanotransferase [Bacteroides sp. 214]
MRLSFHIEYHTNWGEEIRLSGSSPMLGMGSDEGSVALYTTDGRHWNVEVELECPTNGFIEYHYLVFRNGHLVREEWKGVPRKLELPVDSQQSYIIYDSWQDIPKQLHFYSSAFTESLLAHHHRSATVEHHSKNILFKVQAPRINNNCCLAICGNQELLGNWNPDKALPMSDANFPEWQITLNASTLNYPLEYKFVLYNLQEQRAEMWESQSNHILDDPHLRKEETLVLATQQLYFDLPVWKGAGVAVPVFSLRSESSFGIGDFGDLKQMVDWAIITNQQIVQILPINDTTINHTWTDSYPYNSISIYAFHPMYMDIGQMGILKDKKKAQEFVIKQKELNALTTVDYEAVDRVKWEYFHLIYAQEGAKVLASDAFNLFFEENKEWLVPYAFFCYLRDKYNTANFQEWPEHATYDANRIKEYSRPDKTHYKDIALYFYIQFNLHLQLTQVTTYARQHSVVLKGDIPIGISRNSVEAWTEPHYFNLAGQAGAPPDDFSVNGQNWGFPTYNWDVMEKDGYSWWMKRFKKMAEYFDAYRIDHILGFFRIWEIPTNAVHGLLGQFTPALPMSKEEVASYGINFDEERFLNPLIDDSFLEQLFGSQATYVKEQFTEPIGDTGKYRIRFEFNTQRKIEAFFANNDNFSLSIRDGLYRLISNVLFLRDHKDPEKFHPRISAQLDYQYKQLTTEEQEAFNHLYNHFYFHRHNEFWHQQAMKKLPKLTQSTRMMVCGEDLGMIPESVSWVMNDLRILSLEIQRMPKEPNCEFGNLNKYPYLSVCTISTHDMSTLRGWWEEDYTKTQRYFNTELALQGIAPVTATAEICHQVVHNHLESNSMLCILALQDWLSINAELRNPNAQAERINIPSNPKHYWQYRMHLTIEELLRANNLNDQIKTLINQTSRNPHK